MFIPEINGLTFRATASYPADAYVFDKSVMSPPKPPKPKRTSLLCDIQCKHKGEHGCMDCKLSECHRCQGLRCSTCIEKDTCEDYICLDCINYPYQCGLCVRFNKFKRGEC